MSDNKILLIHLGGLGDVCLSESIFNSLRKHFGNRLVGLGNRRFLELFSEYFASVESIESRKWLYLFSEKLTGPGWAKVIFIGKDRETRLRSRWQGHSEEEIMFIDMYPEGAFGARMIETNGQKMHIEDYELTQLRSYGIEPLKKKPVPSISSRVILYPEKGFTKEKWNPGNFLALYALLEAEGVDVTVLESIDLKLNAGRKVFLQDLKEIQRFFAQGGIFVSNDSGMAHLAGASGLFTVTIFSGFDPAIWHPRGDNLVLRSEASGLPAHVVEKTVREILFRLHESGTW